MHQSWRARSTIHAFKNMYCTCSMARGMPRRARSEPVGSRGLVTASYWASTRTCCTGHNNLSSSTHPLLVRASLPTRSSRWLLSPARPARAKLLCVERAGARLGERGGARVRGCRWGFGPGFRTWRCLSWGWGLAYQHPTRARDSRIYVLAVGQSLYGSQSH